MAQICGACQTVNRDAAKYCRGCARRFSLPGAAGESIESAPGDLSLERPFSTSWAMPIPAPEQQRAATGLRAALIAASQGLDVDVSVVWLSMLLLLSGVAFVLWYGGRASAPRPVAPRPSLLLPATAQLPTEPATAPTLRATQPPPGLDPAIETAADTAQATSDAPATAVAKFYRALSAGDGDAAAAFVTPSKRGIGPFNGSNMSAFFGSFKEPLFIRSLRQIDTNIVEAKYRYRVARTACEGTAIVETERISRQTLIRRIRANC